MHPPTVRTQTILTALFALVFAVGYLGFRYFYGFSGDFPFAQELVLVFLGAVATVLITGMLINRQTELELRKEGKVLLLDQKNSVYMAVTEKVAEIVEHARWDDAMIADLRVINHRLAIIGSAAVIADFQQVLKSLQAGLADGELTDAQADAVMDALARLTFAMRADLLGEIVGDDQRAVLEQIMANSRSVEAVDDLDLGGASVGKRSGA